MDNKQNHPDWDSLPAPDQEQSWQKMKALLDKDDDHRVPPPVFFRTCAGWGLFGITLLIAIWFIVRPGEMWRNQKTTREKKEQTVGSKQHESLPHTQKQNAANKNELAIETIKEEIVERKNAETSATNDIGIESHSYKKQITKSSSDHQLWTNQKSVSKTKTRGKIKAASKTAIVKMMQKSNIQSRTETRHYPSSSIKDLNASEDKPEMPTGMYPLDSIDKAGLQDTTRNLRRKQDTAIKAETQPVDGENKNQQKKKLFYLTAGVGLQQQIPTSGQDAFPYNYYGRKGSLSDYIPSAFVRLHKGNKWFVQAEFRYGAPQSVKDFSYSRQTVYDTSTQSLTTTSLYLRKTYYHQIPLSFNYYVKPNWSVGVGGVYSRFYGAVTEEEVTSRNVFTQAEKISRKVVQIPHYNDSFLYKTQLHLLIQTDYQWKRFSFGLRYKKDIQPYIKYTQPDGKVDVKKNQSLEAIIRFRIVRTRMFGL